MLSLRRSRIFRQNRTFAERPVKQVASAIGAEFVELVGTICAESALHRTDEGTMEIGGQVASALFAIGSHFKHVIIP
jgi:hypothetical protein